MNDDESNTSPCPCHGSPCAPRSPAGASPRSLGGRATAPRDNPASAAGRAERAGDPPDGQCLGPLRRAGDGHGDYGSPDPREGAPARHAATNGRGARAAMGETGGAAATAPARSARSDEAGHGDAVPPAHAGALARGASALLRQPHRPRAPRRRGLLGRVARRDTVGDARERHGGARSRDGQRPASSCPSTVDRFVAVAP